MESEHRRNQDAGWTRDWRPPYSGAASAVGDVLSSAG